VHPEHDPCHSDRRCGGGQQGQQQLCSQSEASIVGRHGGFATHVVANENALVALPDAQCIPECAALMTSGLAVYAPLVEFAVPKNAKIAVLGLGGLGHLALQFYTAWGCDVVVFSSDESKREDAMALGAQGFVDSHDEMAVLNHFASFDMIVSTVHADLAWASYVACLKPKGRLHFLGLPFAPLDIGVMPLLSQQRSISASQSGSMQQLEEMLSFARIHSIQARIQVYPFNAAAAALEALQAGTVRYKAVCDVKNFALTDAFLLAAGVLETDQSAAPDREL